MESIFANLSHPVRVEAFGQFIEDRGGYVIDVAYNAERVAHFGLARGDAHIYLWIDRPSSAEIAVDVGHGDGSLELAFEFATALTDEWGGAVWCNEVPGYEEEYLKWLPRRER